MTAEPAQAQDVTAIPPTRLEFDATGTPEKCSRQETFEALLAVWVKTSDVLKADAQQRLLVHLRQAPNRSKEADVQLMDPDGNIVGRVEQTHPAGAECHKILYETANRAAKLLGAFKPPLPKPAVACPVSPSCPSCPNCPSCPIAHHAPCKTPPMPGKTADVPRSFFGLGAFFGTGVLPGIATGPQVFIAFVPSRHWPRFNIEFDGAWATDTQKIAPTLQSQRLHAVPMAGSFCYAPGVLRFCSGFMTTFLLTDGPQVDPTDDALRLTWGANVRLGAQFPMHGPFYLRTDVFARFTIEERTFGPASPALTTLPPIATGLAVSGGWSFN